MPAPVWDAPDLRALNELMQDPRSAEVRPSTWDLHIDDLLRQACERRASDLHLSEGLPPMMRIDGRLVKPVEVSLLVRTLQQLGVHGAPTAQAPVPPAG